MNTIPLHLVQSPMSNKETMGSYVRRRRIQLKMTREEVAIKATALGGKVSESFVRDLEIDRFPSPGLKNVEYVARALEIPPLELIALGLDDASGEIGPEVGFGYHSFTHLWRMYTTTTSERLRALVEEIVQMLIDRVSKG